MPVAPLGGANALPSLHASTGQDKKPAAHAGFAAATTAPAPAVPQAAANAEADQTTLSPAARLQDAAADPAPGRIYAEIWRGDVKLAQVDIHGEVTSGAGLVAAGGGAIAGPLLAAQRAVQVAQQTGGEIRSAGQVLDSQTLLMRARLASAYIA